MLPDRKCMQRMQFYIEPDVRNKLNIMARRRGVPVAELIREAIGSYVAREQPTAEDDPVLRMVGAIRLPGDPVDIAVNHGRYIYTKDWESR